jgi:predicted transposase/invertase (TIGR01784 family)
MRDMLKLWQNLFEKLPNAVIIDKKHGYFYISNLLWYIDGKLSEEKRDQLSSLIIEHLTKDDGETLMRTIADNYIEEGIEKGMVLGIEKGIEKGREEGASTKTMEIAINMLRQKLDNSLISSVTGLSHEDILKIQNKL